MVEQSIQNQINELNNVKALAERDASYYPQILDSVLSIAGRKELPLRLWCTDLFISALTTETVDDETKRGICLKLIDTVVNLLNDNDPHLQRNCISLSATIYRVGFAHVAQNPSESHIWSQLEKMKARIFSIWESSHFGTRAESIKFAQQVIVVQMFHNRDPRLARNSQSENDFSLSNVPPNHPLIRPTLEAEAHGLLDRLLSVFTTPMFQSQIIIATIFTLSSLMKTRPTLSSKVLPTIVNFNFWTRDVDARSENEAQLQYRYVEKSLRLFLQHTIKTVGERFTHQVQGYLNELGKPGEKVVQAVDYQREIKRKKLDHNDSLPLQPQKQARFQPSRDNSPVPQSFSNTPPNNNAFSTIQTPSFKDLYTLVQQGSPLENFNAIQFNLEMAINITMASIAAAKPDVYAKSIDTIRQRYEIFSKKNQFDNGLDRGARGQKRPLSNNDNPLLSNDSEESDQEGDNDRISAESIAAENADNPGTPFDSDDDDDDEEFGDVYAEGGDREAFSLPEPSTLNPADKVKAMESILSRMISYEKATVAGEGGTGAILGAITDGKSSGEKEGQGLERESAVREWTQSTWVALITRLLTRGFGDVIREQELNDLSNDSESVKSEVEADLNGKIKAQRQRHVKGVEHMTKFIRDRLFRYCQENFWDRLDIVLEWMNEEWFHEFVRLEPPLRPKSKDGEHSTYYYYVGQVMDTIIPLVDNKYRGQFLRLLSDLPEFNKELIWRLKSLCIDPYRSQIGFIALTYLVRFKPPTKDFSLDLMEELYQANPETREPASHLLKQYRPAFIEKMKALEAPDTKTEEN